jgi:NADPH-dependent curcumin reductase CurA
MLLRTIYLSLDPYMRGRMSPQRSYAAGVKLGDAMVGATVAEVVESHVDGFAPGDIVLSYNGWQTHALSNGNGVVKLDPRQAPVTTALGVLGMPGFTAYVGLLEHGRPKEGETVVVSAASGAVGQIVGQIAKIRGCRAVGVAGAEDKCRMVVDEFGFDAAVNYKEPDFRDRLAAACPKGVDIYFENVGGAVFQAVLPLLNDFARIPVCGRIAHYNDTAAPAGPDRLPGFMGLVLTRRLSVRGFIQFDHLDRMADFRRDMGAWIAAGKVRYREDIVEGFDTIVDAFRGLLQGRNRGKLIVKLGDDPTQ